MISFGSKEPAGATKTVNWIFPPPSEKASERPLSLFMWEHFIHKHFIVKKEKKRKKFHCSIHLFKSLRRVGTSSSGSPYAVLNRMNMSDY